VYFIKWPLDHAKGLKLQQITPRCRLITASGWLPARAEIQWQNRAIYAIL